MKTKDLTDQALVDEIQNATPVSQQVVDEYYRRCIPVYLDFIGIHWHTGFYLDDEHEVSVNDQNRMVQHIADSVELQQQDRVLDVGCGIGGTVCFLANHYGNMVRGLTPVIAQKDIASRMIAKQGISVQAGIDLGHASSLPYPDNSFDVVLFFESPCHFPDREQFFREAFRVLKPGGRLAGEDWLASDISNRHHITHYIEPICKSWAIPMLGDGASYNEQLQTAGFIDVSYTDMRSEMQLSKGFSVSSQQQASLRDEIQQCPSPLLALTLEGLLKLGQGISDEAFTIGRFRAIKSV